MHAEEKEPFLNAGNTESQHTRRSRAPALTKHIVFLFSACNLLILILNVLVVLHSKYSGPIVSSGSTCYEHFPNKLSGAVAEYENEPQLFTKFQNSPFTGSPSKSTDKAWHDLMENMVMRASEDELREGNQTSIPLPEGGYMTWLGAYHELHCIKMLREFKYFDHYHPEVAVGSIQHAHLSVHADHCIEMLRQSAMCHGDGSLTTFKWSPKSEKPMLDLTRPSHKCVNWAVLTESLQDRTVSQEEMNRMRNPEFEA
ncbi:hypothetical protein DE146DRAFT_666940 [Phaeosphaeria sp. MPI-PUGE-AT-0046c]|nr:hypothetical protein DE146DRAFT_666940 [Phaeosphaeria sp. MPI-PUGE-AT-0046c]